jgi:hypothetical protein
MGMRTEDSDIEEESIMASRMATEEGPAEKVVYGGARRGRENSLGLRDGKKGRREGRREIRKNIKKKEGHGRKGKRIQYRAKKSL